MKPSELRHIYGDPRPLLALYISDWRAREREREHAEEVNWTGEPSGRRLSRVSSSFHFQGIGLRLWSWGE